MNVKATKTEMNKHFTKEAIKLVVDSNPNWSDEEKAKIKAIIDKGQNPAEILRDLLAYLGASRVMGGNS